MTIVYTRNQIDEAAEQLKQGKLVAFPTETVFGLGAIANSQQAVSDVFKAKGRPSDNPLIVHVANIDQVHKYAHRVKPIEQELMNHFWPGPLTIVFPVLDGVFAKNVQGGASTIGMRMPDQADTLQLIEKVGFPIVGPSANLSGKPSPTSVEHVIFDFDGVIQGVLENTQPLTAIGVESTVIHVENHQVNILRPGAITKEQIQAVVKMPVIERTVEEQLSNRQVASPGVKYKHYSPNHPLLIMPQSSTVDFWKKIIKQYDSVGVLAQDELLMELSDCEEIIATYSLGSRQEMNQMGRFLYSGLRYLDQQPINVILTQDFEDTPETHAYLNRLHRSGRQVNM